MERKVYQELASRVVARANCIKENNEHWLERHSERIIDLIFKYLPSGSGIDNGNSLIYSKSNGDRLVITSSFHVLDLNGYYDGWIDYTITVKASLQFGIVLDIVGKFKNRTGCIRKDCSDIKDMLYDLYYDALNRVVV